MIKQDNFHNLLQAIGFEMVDNSVSIIYSKKYEESGAILSVDFTNKRLIYPDRLEAERETTKNFHQPENFVVFECVASLLEKGYYPEQIILEKGMPGGHGDTGGFCDIIVKDNNGDEYLLIECKTTEQTENDEFNKAWKLMLHNGGQLFNYYNSYRKAQYICLYTSDWVDGVCKKTYHVISMLDNQDYLLSNRNLKSFEEVTRRGGNRDEYYQVWKDTYQLDYNTKGIFEEEAVPFHIGKKKFTIDDLQTVDATAIQKKYNQFATIMRQYNVSGRENAFDKLVNLFLVKIVDETRHGKELQFIWKGAAYDDYYNFQDRLQKMYQIGMKDYLNEEVTYIDNATIEETFKIQKNDPDAIKEKILEYFRQLKFFSNSDFAFLDVHNEQLFNQNAVILKEVVKMLQDIRLKTEEQNQFLGDLFEGFLDQGVKQSEGQYFTPTPIVRFLVSSLPLESIIRDSTSIPKVIDYACGAGHFLNEYAQQIRSFVKQYKGDEVTEYYKEIFGIEKEYRLSKVAKVSSFMYGQEGINIIYADALSNKVGLKEASFSVLIANPPYSVKGFLETLSLEEREKYELSSEVNDLAKNNSIETFFIERAKQLLSPGGVAAIILPSSVLSNGNIYIKCREILLKYFNIVSIVEMGSGTFGKTGTNTVTLFLRRKSENPALAVHYKYRVDAWFMGNTTHDERYADLDLLERYCERIGVSVEDYKTLFSSTPNESLLGIDLFKDYIDKFKNDSRAKKIKTKRITSKYTEEMRKVELRSYIISSIKAIEKEKLYFFLLAMSNQQPVVIVKSPSKTAGIKKFLGYEWSSSKGNEGIKYIGVSDADEDNELDRNKGIAQIQTPLFDPADLHNENKINMIIRHNFLGEELNISAECEEYVSINNFADLIDFSRVEFDKVIKTSINREIKVQSKYELLKLKDTALIQKGQSITSAECKEGKIKVVAGGINYAGYHNEANREANVITISASGANAGFVNLWKEPIFASDCTTVVGKNDIETFFIYNFLKSIQHQIFYLQKGSAQPHVYPKDIERIPIPKVPEDIINRIVNECNQVDEEYDIAISQIDIMNQKINDIILPVFSLYEHKRLETLCSSFEYGTSSKSLPTGKVAVVRMGNIQNGRIVWDDVVYSNDPDDIAQYMLHENDVLFNRTNSPVHVGKSAIYTGDRPAIFAGYLIRVNYKKDLLNPKYLNYILNSKPIREHGFSVMSKSINQANISAGLLKQYEIPVPSLEQQNVIVAQIEEYEADIDKAQSVIDGYGNRKNAIIDRYLK
ncbi:N-6 DNA methylase [Phocaeicola faecium]|uniref:site-specific DNA-methyltransferase (adenine-specific) n=1 Tax=Phocaeicola faecium TaxID=2762213 RepID=A0ABR8V9C1_9BACT|nr:N-6 DNA methylase [Phocaeicola faecium]MBD8001374.1 N-6 DNA methylase [Phocaeicola faecium]